MPFRVLILSARPDDVRVLQRALANARDGPFEIETASTMLDGLRSIGSGTIDAILVDLLLEDAQGLACFDRLHAAARHTPILTLCGLDDEADAIEAVQRGAQGWLSRGYYDNYLVPQSLRNVIERMKVERSVYVAQARAEITLDSIADAVVSVDVTGRVDYLNTAAETICGWSRSEAHGLPVADVLKFVDGDSGHAIANPIDYTCKATRP
ncbi:response regulator [Massilia timonae]|uniref:Sensory box protein n=1 Tax=Massilia timonae TaxID=47229 RepID=A0A1S2NC94_9BURK|nr:response regulator [Massilia timonae]OIJ42473.1 sensory box protein [Massilia timonae]